MAEENQNDLHSDVSRCATYATSISAHSLTNEDPMKAENNIACPNTSDQSDEEASRADGLTEMHSFISMDRDIEGVWDGDDTLRPVERSASPDFAYEDAEVAFTDDTSLSFTPCQHPRPWQSRMAPMMNHSSALPVDIPYSIERFLRETDPSPFFDRSQRGVSPMNASTIVEYTLEHTSDKSEGGSCTSSREY